MKLAAIDIIPIRAPRKETVRSGAGQLGINASEFGIVRIFTEPGLDGVGEISITAPRIGHTLCYAARTLIAPELIGMDPSPIPPFSPGSTHSSPANSAPPISAPPSKWHCSTSSASTTVSPSMDSLAGKSAIQSRSRGGSIRSHRTKWPPTPAAAIDAGFHAIKLKVGRILVDDLAAVRAVSTALDHKVPLRLDANMAWKSVPEAANAIATLAAEAPISWIEQPLSRHNLVGLQLFASAPPSRSWPTKACKPSKTPMMSPVTRPPTSGTSISSKPAVSYQPRTSSLSPLNSISPAFSAVKPNSGSAQPPPRTSASPHQHSRHPIETFGPLRYDRDIVTTRRNHRQRRPHPLRSPRPRRRTRLGHH